MKVLRKIRDIAGVALLDLPRFRQALHQRSGRANGNSKGWISICNRIERLTPNPDGPGVHCDWKWGSELHACLVWPRLGYELMRAAVHEWPIRFADQPVSQQGPRVSFVFAHSGRDRTRQLRRTIRSVFAQQDVRVECIVVGQSPSPVEGVLPNRILFRHLNKASLPPGWYKSWAYNVGARIASGEILIFQDGDVCAPERYAAEVANAILRRGYDAASLQRFLFYLDRTSTGRVDAADTAEIRCFPERVFQNWKGGTIAIHREAFFNLGGFDEGFVDWGGEDDEFYDRCGALRHCRFGYLPFIHLWHRPQQDRKLADNLNISRIMPWRMRMHAEDRIAELTSRDFGNPLHPDPLQSYKSSVSSGTDTHVAEIVSR